MFGIRKSGRRLYKALNLMVGFLGLKIIILGAIPVVYYWLLKRLPAAWSGKPLSDLSLLVASYPIVGLGVYIWKFVEAGHVLKEEDKIAQPREEYFQRKLASFSPEEKDALAEIVITGSASVGRQVYELPALSDLLSATLKTKQNCAGQFVSQHYCWLWNRILVEGDAIC
jgi:hypothetical protein